MSDFYPLLVRAVAKLSIDSPQARQELYEHARTYLATQLSEHEPRVSVSKFMREQIALEIAIRRIETQSQAVRAQPPNRPEPPVSHSTPLPGFGTTAQPVAADHEWSEVYFDRAPDQSGMSHRPRATLPREPSADAEAFTRAPTALRNREITDQVVTIPETDATEQIAPRDVSSGTSIRMDATNGNGGLPFRTRLNRQTNTEKSPAIEESFARNRSLYLNPTIIGLAAIVAMLTFIAVISIPMALIYFPRLIWLSEHLLDHPMLFVAILIIVAGTLVLFFAMIGPLRKKATLQSFRLLISPSK